MIGQEPTTAAYQTSTHTLCRACGDIFTHKPWDWRDASINHALDKHPAAVPDVVFVNLDSAGWLLGHHAYEGTTDE